MVAREHVGMTRLLRAISDNFGAILLLIAAAMMVGRVVMGG